MTSSEVSIKDNCGNQRGDSFSSGFSDHNDVRNNLEGQNSHPTVSAAGRGNSGEFGFISADKLWILEFPCAMGSDCCGFLFF